jgi:tetratricopeptide (TPR) repeat protein
MRAACVALLLCAAPAVADEHRAQELFRSGLQHYNLAEFDAAIADFKAAYEASQAPGLLFNLAQAARLAHRDEEAVHFYKTYLRLKPDASNRVYAELRIAELESVRAPPPQQPPPGRPLVLGGAITAGLGVGLVAAGIGVGVDASRLSDATPVMGKKGDMTQPLADQAQREMIAADVLYAVGGAAAIAGTITALVGWRRGVVRNLGVAPAPHGAQVSASFSF